MNPASAVRRRKADAGAIIKDNREEDVHGLTTAASVWLTASVGIASGLGREVSAILATVLAFLVLSTLGRISRSINTDPPP